MYNSVIPSYNSSDKDKKNSEVINADDPRNADKIDKMILE